MQLQSRYYLICVALGALAIPGVAHAATKPVLMGTPPANQNALMRVGSDINAFFPSSIAVNVGDTVSFRPVAFHTVQFPDNRGRFVPLFTPRGRAVSGVNDEAGVPFWFNGQPDTGFNPLLLRSGFGKRFSYSGRTGVLSGLPLARRPRPMSVRFTRAGLFRYICDLHPGMRGSVRVRNRGDRVPSAAADARRVKRQAASGLSIARSLVSTDAPPNTVIVGPQGRSGVHRFTMAPDNLTVPAGTTVTFRMANRSTEVHTASFGPGAETFGPGPGPDMNSYLGRIAAAFEGPGDPRATFPSEMPGTPPAVLSPALHGNGFWNSGILDAVSASPPPASNRLTFNTPGVYSYGCIVHPFMKGTITVQ